MNDSANVAAAYVAALEQRDWPAVTSMLHPDVVYEVPQTRERIVGRDRYVQFNQEYAGDWHLRVKVAITDESHAVAWFGWTLDGEASDGIAFFDVEDGRIVKVTDFWPESYDAPQGREHLTEPM